MTKKFVVYGIRIGETTRYIGRTNNLLRRQKQHRQDYINGLKKPLWNKIRELKTFSAEDIILIPIRQFNNEVDAKRFECFLILGDYFKAKNLWQKVPNITDGW